MQGIAGYVYTRWIPSRLVRSWDGAGNGAAIRYDFGGRRTLVETTGGAAQQFEYDPMGNIIAAVDGVGNRTGYILDKWGRVTEIRQADGSSEYYGYDHAGNLTRSTDGEGRSVSYEYNAANLLSAVTDAEGFRETYAYDAENRLCRKRDRNGAEILYTYNMYGNPLERRAKAAGAEASELSECYEYDAWGNLTVCKETVGNRFKFNGQQYDPVSQQYYLRARYYNPVIGRFTQEDTYRGTD